MAKAGRTVRRGKTRGSVKRTRPKQRFAFLIREPFRANARKVIPSPKDAAACKAFLNTFKSDLAVLEETSFEARIGMYAMAGAVAVGQIKLNFACEKGKRVLLIDAIQGEKGIKYLRWAFRRFSGLLWPNYLVRMAIETAKKAGFSEVRIQKAEENPYFRWHGKETGLEAEKRQERMQKLYRGVAQAEGFQETDEYFFRVI